MEPINVEVPVEEWDLKNYPAKDKRDEKPGSDYFLLVFKDKTGKVGMKTYREKRRDESGRLILDEDTGKPIVETVEYEQRKWAVVGGAKEGMKNYPVTSRIMPEDLRRAEEMIEGKPTEVLMGLWYYPLYVGDRITKWVAIDRKKAVSPPFKRDVTDLYYSEWRKAAYDDDNADPYQGQHRPYTQIQELELENKKLREAVAKK
jgi:hypothetical protein